MTLSNSRFFDVPGTVVAPTQLGATKSRDLALELQAGRIDFATFVDCRKGADADWVVFDVGVEVSQGVRLHLSGMALPAAKCLKLLHLLASSA